MLQEFRPRLYTFHKDERYQGREEKREVKIRWTDPKRIDRARTWIVGEGISIIQAEAAIREDRKVDVRWPMKKPAGEFLASRLASAVVRKRQKISQGPSLRVALSTARNLFQSFILRRPLVIISTRHASNLGCQWPSVEAENRKEAYDFLLPPSIYLSARWILLQRALPLSRLFVSLSRRPIPVSSENRVESMLGNSCRCVHKDRRVI